MSATLGNTLEYFDFAIYGALAATLFPRLFFHQLGSTAGLLASFATFGVGFIARPIGAVVLGHLGDRYGRKPVLFATLLMMGGSSVLIGLLPTNQGILIAVLLVVLRCLQGFSLGGESSGSQLLTMEHCERGRRGFFGSLIIIGSPISQVLANLVIVVLSVMLTPAQFESWGWRIPFLGSVFIVGIAYFIRRRLEETPAFAATNEEAAPQPGATRAKGLRVLWTHPRQVVLLLLAWSGTTLSFYLIAVYGLSYLTTNVGMSSQDAFVILMIANGVSVLTAVIGGLTCDRIGRKPVWYAGLAGCFIGVVLFFTVASTSVVVTGLIVTLVLASIQFLSGAQPALFAEQFPTDVRYSGTALAYTGANLVFSAPAPFVAAGLTALGGPALVAAFTSAIIIVSAVAVSKLREGQELDLAEFTLHDATERNGLAQVQADKECE
ncbi:MFS transporter [Saccharopolyspora pogona]|uniref:MFS transporter n=1 Tax=Saccharopolyspora pogona TaxID=333966 RepID=UPI0016820642|nr:MFS transporter [Saccharopolyspora pogona]